MEQIKRIRKMEESYNSVKKAIEDLASAMEAYQEKLPMLQELSEYYQSDTWMYDFQDDENGKIPPNLARGVLSEDGMNSLLEDNTELMDDLEQLLSVFQMDEFC